MSPLERAFNFLLDVQKYGFYERKNILDEISNGYEVNFFFRCLINGWLLGVKKAKNHLLIRVKNIHVSGNLIINVTVIYNYLL